MAENQVRSRTVIGSKPIFKFIVVM